MALALTIGGSNFLPQYKTGTAVIREQLQNRANTLTLQLTKKPAQSKPTEGQEIILTDGARYLFAGFITRIDPTEVGEGAFFTYRVEATDYTYILINHNAQKTYTNETLHDIVDDLVSTYAPGYSLTFTNVDTGPLIEKMVFNHISLRKCFEKLSKISGFEWWIDYQKNIYFKPVDYTPAPESFTDATNNMSQIDIQYDASQIRNSIVVKGGREETTSNFVQDILGDGEAREWLLREKPTTMVSVELDTGSGFVAKVIGRDPTDDDTGNDFMYNKEEKYLRATATTTTPTSSHVIRVTYKYEVPIITKLKSTSSIAAMQALEGGDGLHEYVITNPAIKTKEEARQIALKELDQYADPLINATVQTRTGLLGGSSLFRPGQELTVNLPSWGISTDTKYLIQEVVTTLVEGTTGIEYHYSIRFGGRLLNATSFLLGLASKEEVIDADEEVDRIEAVQEDITISETVARDTNERTVNSDSLSIVETTPSQTKTTPPFKWAPSGTKKLMWNKGEWG